MIGRYVVNVVMEPGVPFWRDLKAVWIAVVDIFDPSIAAVPFGLVLKVAVAELVLAD